MPNYVINPVTATDAAINNIAPENFIHYLKLINETGLDRILENTFGWPEMDLVLRYVGDILEELPSEKNYPSVADVYFNITAEDIEAYELAEANEFNDLPYADEGLNLQQELL